MNFKNWLYEWMEFYIKPISKPKTCRCYYELINNHIIPFLGKYETDEIEPIEVQKFISHLLLSGNLKTGEGLSNNTVNSIITVIQNSMKSAYNLGYTKDYTMNKIKRPKHTERKIECFTAQEQSEIENAVRKRDNTRYNGILICLYTGIRIGELLALTWDDINFMKGEMTINKTCCDLSDSNGKYLHMTVPPKTESSNRIIPLPEKLLLILSDMKKVKKGNYIIENAGKPIFIRSYQRTFELLLKKNNINHRGFHSLRHTFATRALECGMDVKTLSEIMGHKNADITLNRYAHSMPDHKKYMMNKVCERL